MVRLCLGLEMVGMPPGLLGGVASILDIETQDTIYRSYSIFSYFTFDRGDVSKTGVLLTTIKYYTGMEDRSVF